MGEQRDGKPIKRICAGLLAHVDAGKTTLSEGMLYVSGALKKLGRVDHRDAFLDTDPQERQRGITIFSKQARLTLEGMEIILLDTPGHVDFSTEMERTLQVLDYAILVISGTDGVQGHTETLWQLLKRYRVPTFLFINKMDLAGSDRDARMAELRARLDGRCVDFSAEEAVFQEEAATANEMLLERFLDRGELTQTELAQAIARREIFPCYFGSALKLEGIDGFLDTLERYTLTPVYPDAFGAKIYKISRDNGGNRLTWMKITGGDLRTKEQLTNEGAMQPNGQTPPEGQIWREKVEQIRLYSGAKFKPVQAVSAGEICAVTGLTRTCAGQVLGGERPSALPSLEPVMTYQVQLPGGADVHLALKKLKELEEEDPQLHVTWQEALQEIQVQLMGEVQLQVLSSLIRERFGITVAFASGRVVYKETIASPVEGAGHFEPLRHYAEVHLLLEPGERGSGLVVDTVCSEDVLDRNWQRLILTHLEEKEHVGVLTGSPVTDMRITLLTGRAHPKHTEGGDFRQATYRALRQGLMKAESVLLEPWYSFRLEVPNEAVGRAMADIQKMNGRFDGPQVTGELSALTGSAPVSAIQNYAETVSAYTKGRGRFFCSFQGYEPCSRQEEVVREIGYSPEKDLDNPASSVFCSHGAGFLVPWDQAEDYMHQSTGWQPEGEPAEEPVPVRRQPSRSTDRVSDRELEQIFEKTYGPTRRRDFRPQKEVRREEIRSAKPSKPAAPPAPQEEYLLVDGYNIIFAWDDLKELAKVDLAAARQSLMDTLCNYQGWKGCHVILVYDAYKVPGGRRRVDKYHNIHVVYTQEAETADMYIEKVTYEIGKKHRIRVATSDGLEQMIILGHGSLRVSARMFRQEVEEANAAIARSIEAHNQPFHTGIRRSSKKGSGEKKKG